MRKSIAAILVLLGLFCIAARSRADIVTGAMYEQAVHWFKEVNIGGPDGPMVRGVSESLQQVLDDGRHVVLTLPGRLSKSGNAYYGVTWAGNFYTFELTPEQASQLEIDPEGACVQEGTARRETDGSFPSRQIVGLNVSNSGNLTGDSKISGSLSSDVFNAEDSLVLRVAYRLPKSTTYVTKPLSEIPADGILNFSIDAINEANEGPYVGPLPVFVDLCLETEAGKYTVVSNTLTTLLNIGPSSIFDFPAFNNTTVSGTTWKFSGTETTVKFLEGGNVEFNNSVYGGHWEQDGNHLKFDSNNYTLFEVEIDGREMTGAWRRLQGEAISSSTHLEQIDPN